MKNIAELNSKYSFFVRYFPPLEDSAGFFGKEKAKQKRGRISVFNSVSKNNFLLMRQPLAEEVNQLANWLLYVAADEVDFIPRKWEKNKSNPAPKPDKLSIAKTHRSVERLFLTFDKEVGK